MFRAILDALPFFSVYCFMVSVTTELENNISFEAIKIINLGKLISQMERRILNRLKIVLAEKRLKNKDLAKALHKTESTVSQWCSNYKQPSVETFYEIALYLDVDFRDLFISTKKNKG